MTSRQLSSYCVWMCFCRGWSHRSMTWLPSRSTLNRFSQILFSAFRNIIYGPQLLSSFFLSTFRFKNFGALSVGNIESGVAQWLLFEHSERSRNGPYVPLRTGPIDPCPSVWPSCISLAKSRCGVLYCAFKYSEFSRSVSMWGRKREDVAV